MSTTNKILFEVNGSMYGHPAAGRIVQHEFITLMIKHGYYEDPNVPCLFKHITRPTSVRPQNLIEEK